MHNTNVLIIEDEEAAVGRLKKTLMEIDPQINIVGQIASVQSAVKYFRENPPPDLIILDINLADGPSFEIFKHVHLKTPIIFTTAYDEHALKAFKVNSVDYLLKPIKPAELINAYNKYKELHLNNNKSPEIDYAKIANLISQNHPEYKERIVTRFGGLIKVINISDAAYFYTENKVTYVCTKQKNKFAIDETLEDLEHVLDPKIFFRINRQFIVSIGSIEKMVVVSKSRVKISLNPPSEFETIASTERSSHFKKWLEGR